jgi:hypothetical protein
MQQQTPAKHLFVIISFEKLPENGLVAMARLIVLYPADQIRVPSRRHTPGYRNNRLFVQTSDNHESPIRGLLASIKIKLQLPEW